MLWARYQYILALLESLLGVVDASSGVSEVECDGTSRERQYMAIYLVANIPPHGESSIMAS
jgi:hypothetical protein